MATKKTKKTVKTAVVAKPAPERRGPANHNAIVLTLSLIHI